MTPHEIAKESITEIINCSVTVTQMATAIRTGLIYMDFRKDEFAVLLGALERINQEIKSIEQLSIGPRK